MKLREINFTMMNLINNIHLTFYKETQNTTIL